MRTGARRTDVDAGRTELVVERALLRLPLALGLRLCRVVLIDLAELAVGAARIVEAEIESRQGEAEDNDDEQRRKNELPKRPIGTHGDPGIFQRPRKLQQDRRMLRIDRLRLLPA